jgi:hypothetical protein
MSDAPDRPGTAPPPPAREIPPPDKRILLVCFLVGCALAVALANGLVASKPGNRLVIVNAGGTFVDSVTVDPEPAGANWFYRRWGMIAAKDSAWFRLPPQSGDADVKVYRGGHVISDDAVQFSGNTIFEVRVGDAAHLGRYRRLGR